MSLYNILIYGRRPNLYFYCDQLLASFGSSGVITFDALYKKIPNGLNQAIEMLIKEGYIIQVHNGIRITPHGTLFRDSGGYGRYVFRNRVIFASIIIGILLGITGLVFTILQFAE